MTRIKSTCNINDIIELYNSGKNLRDVAHIVHKRTETVKRILIENGVELRIPPNAPVELSADILKVIVADYQSGVSEYALANRYNVGRSVIRRYLKQAGVVIRSCSEANKISASNRTPEENAALAEAAHNAVRGKPIPYERLVKRAFSIQASFTDYKSPYERAIAAELRHRGINFVPQLAVDKYNIDFALWDNIAFEVYGGGWHAKGRHAARFDERSKKLFDSGYAIVICWVNFNTMFSPSGIVDYLVSLHDVLGANPAALRKHYVIGSDGKPCATGSSNLHYVS